MGRFDEPPNGVTYGILKPRKTKLGRDPMGSPVFEDRVKIIPRSDWPDLLPKTVTLSHRVKKVKNQDGEGSCASNMALSTMEVIRDAQGSEVENTKGKTLQFVELSAAGLYKRVNGGRDAGSSIDDNLEELANVGALPVTGQGFDHEFDQVGWRNPLPSGYKETAKLFRFSEWNDVATVEGFVTNLILGNPVAYGRNGHAIVAIFARLDERGRLEIVYLNSWGQWGQANGPHKYGFGVDDEADFARWIDIYGAWSPRVATGGLVLPQYVNAG